MPSLRAITEDVQRTFFAEARACYERAVATRGEICRSYAIAGTIVRLRFAGDRLVPRLVPALEHLRAPDTVSADLDVHLWDTRSTGAAMVPPPCPQRCFTDRGNIWGLESAQILAAFQYGECSVSLFDVAAGQAIYWVEDAERLPFWSTAAPLRTMLSWWLARNGMQLVHGAVVGTDAGAVLISGKGGSGKSSTALACVAAGMSYVGDDYVGIALDPAPRAYSLYGTAKLEPRQIERFPELAADASVGREGSYEKAVVFLPPVFASRLRAELPLAAVLIPTITGESDTTLAPIDVLTVERAASLPTIAQLPHSGQRTVDFIARLVRLVPRARVRLGTNLEGIAGVIENCARHGDAFRAVASTGEDAGAARDDRPLISVVIPTFNGADFLREAVASVVAQDYPRLEIIIVNDGSTDRTRQMAESLEADHRYFEFESNQGPAEARNRGVREAAADYIAFLDVDDLWPAGRLASMVARLLADDAIDVLSGRAQMLEREDDSGGYRAVGDPRRSFPFFIGAGLYRRRAFLLNGPFDRAFRFGEDSDWYLRAFETGLSCVQTDDVTLQVRRHGANMTRGKTNLELNQARVFKARLDRKRAREPRPD